MDTEQIELFPAMEYVDLSHGMTARSTRSKTPTKRRKQSPSTKVTIALQASRTRLKRGLRLLWRVKIEPLTSSITN